MLLTVSLIQFNEFHFKYPRKYVIFLQEAEIYDLKSRVKTEIAEQFFSHPAVCFFIVRKKCQTVLNKMSKKNVFTKSPQ